MPFRIQDEHECAALMPLTPVELETLRVLQCTNVAAMQHRTTFVPYTATNYEALLLEAFASFPRLTDALLSCAQCFIDAAPDCSMSVQKLIAGAVETLFLTHESYLPR